jgi:hypothetical protein
LRAGVLERTRDRRADRDDPVAAFSRRVHCRDRRCRQVVRLVERKARIERGIAGRRQAGGMRQRREADAARGELVEQAPVEDEAGRGRLERDRLRRDRGPHVPERERRGDVRVLDRPAVTGDAGADRVGSAGEAQLDQARRGDDANDVAASGPSASVSPAASGGGSGRSSVRVRQSPAPKTTARKHATSSPRASDGRRGEPRSPRRSRGDGRTDSPAASRRRWRRRGRRERAGRPSALRGMVG